jgi:hypothetical protein
MFFLVRIPCNVSGAAMTVDKENEVDFIALDDQDNEVQLIIMDHLPWDDPKLEGEHLMMLQQKLNRYLAFIESGELYRKSPDAKGRRIVIKVVGLYKPSPNAAKFIRLVEGRLAEDGMTFGFDLRPDLAG